MEERKYTFYDRYQKVKYANITVEELEVLNISYNKEHYMFDQQHQRNNTVLFCGLESEYRFSVGAFTRCLLRF